MVTLGDMASGSGVEYTSSGPFGFSLRDQKGKFEVRYVDWMGACNEVANRIGHDLGFGLGENSPLSELKILKITNESKINNSRNNPYDIGLGKFLKEGHIDMPREDKYSEPLLIPFLRGDKSNSTHRRDNPYDELITGVAGQNRDSLRVKGGGIISTLINPFGHNTTVSLYDKDGKAVMKVRGDYDHQIQMVTPNEYSPANSDQWKSLSPLVPRIQGLAQRVCFEALGATNFAQNFEAWGKSTVNSKELSEEERAILDALER